MITVSKSKFKAHALQILRELEQSGEEVIITDHNRPVARVLPYLHKRPVEDVFGDWHGKAVIHEDLDTPTVEEWDEA